MVLKWDPAPREISQIPWIWRPERSCYHRVFLLCCFTCITASDLWTDQRKSGNRTIKETESVIPFFPLLVLFIYLSDLQACYQCFTIHIPLIPGCVRDSRWKGLSLLSALSPSQRNDKHKELSCNTCLFPIVSFSCLKEHKWQALKLNLAARHCRCYSWRENCHVGRVEMTTMQNCRQYIKTFPTRHLGEASGDGGDFLVMPI